MIWKEIEIKNIIGSPKKNPCNKCKEAMKTAGKETIMEIGMRKKKGILEEEIILIEEEEWETQKEATEEEGQEEEETTTLEKDEVVTETTTEEIEMINLEEVIEAEDIMMIGGEVKTMIITETEAREKIETTMEAEILLETLSLEAEVVEEDKIEMTMISDRTRMLGVNKQVAGIINLKEIQSQEMKNPSKMMFFRKNYQIMNGEHKKMTKVGVEIVKRMKIKIRDKKKDLLKNQMLRQKEEVVEAEANKKKIKIKLHGVKNQK